MGSRKRSDIDGASVELVPTLVLPEADAPLLLNAAWRKLPRSDASRLLRSACQTTEFKTRMHRLNLIAVPPKLTAALSSPRGWMVVVEVGRIVHRNMFRDEPFDPVSSSLSCVWEAAQAVEDRYESPEIATLWLTWVYGGFLGAPALLAVQALLRSSRWQLKAVDRIAPAFDCDRGQMARDVATGELTHPAARIPASELVAKVLLDAVDDEGTVAWVTGRAAQAADPDLAGATVLFPWLDDDHLLAVAAGEASVWDHSDLAEAIAPKAERQMADEHVSPSVEADADQGSEADAATAERTRVEPAQHSDEDTAPLRAATTDTDGPHDGSTGPVTTAASGLGQRTGDCDTAAQRLRHAHAALSEQVDKARMQLRRGRIPGEELGLALARMHSEAAAVADTANLPVAELDLDTLIALATPTDPEAVLLDRLAACEVAQDTPGSALEDALQALRDACAQVVDEPEVAGPGDLPLRDALVELATLLDEHPEPPVEQVFELIGVLPQPLHVIAFAASHGRVRLPGPDPEDAETVATTAESTRPPQAEERLDPAAPVARDDPHAATDRGPHDELEPQGTHEYDPEVPTVHSDETSGAETPDAEDAEGEETEQDDSGGRASVPEDPTGHEEPDRGSDAADDAFEAVDRPDVDVEGAADADEVTREVPAPDDAPDDADVWPESREVERLLTDTLQRHDPAAAYWIAEAFDDESGRATALKLLTLAPHMRRDSGPTTTEFVQSASRLPIEQVATDGATRALMVAALLRAVFASPWAVQSLLERGIDHLGGTPSVRHVLEAARAGAIAGVRLGATTVTGVPDELSAEAQRLSEQAAQLLEEGPVRTSGYHAATRVWQLWVDADTGWLGQLLKVVAADDRSRLAVVKAEREQTSTDRQLVDRMNRTDSEERGPEHRDIEYHGRDSLLRRTYASLAVIDDWIDLVESDRQARYSVSYEDQAAADLRRVLSDHGDLAIEELTKVGDDPTANAAAGLAHAVLTDAFALMQDGRAPTGREPQPSQLLLRPLLRTDLAIDRSNLRPVDAGSFEQLALLATPVSWYQAFQRRVGRRDYDEAALLVVVMRQFGDDNAELAADELDEHVVEAERAARQRWLEVRSQLDRAKRYGLLDADDALLYDIAIEELDLTGAAEDERSATVPSSAAAGGDVPASVRTDVGRVLRDLDALEDEVGEATATRRRAELARLDTMAARLPELRERYDEVVELINQARFAQADEIMAQVEEGIAPSPSSVPEWFKPELLRSVTTPVAPGEELLAAVRGRATCGMLDFTAISDTEAAARYLATPAKVLTSPAADITTMLRSLLLRLGLTMPVSALASSTPSGARHRWVDVIQVSALGAPIHQFGSTLAGRLRVLVTPATMLVDQIVALLDNEADNRAVLLLHTGSLTLRDRRDLERKLRDVSVPVLPFDTHLLAARLTLPDDSWASSCGLAAPFSGVNPFVWNQPGNSLPNEAFFGRRSELKALLDPLGGATVFGGRQLGKTALLKQAARRFATYGDGAKAVLRSIKDTGVDHDAAALWGEIRAMLAEAEIPTPRSDEQPGAEQIIADVQAWLAEDDERRLLLLLDEADYFLTADGPHYVQLERIKQLTDSRPVRVVFAGLNDVTRFQRDANHPFVHLGSPLGIGGLAPGDAMALLRTPLQAIGVDVTDDVLLGAVTYANYHPAILQRFGHALVGRVTEEHPQAALRELTSDDVDAVFADRGLSEYVQQLLGNTLRLDSRYGVVACALALADLSANHDALPEPRSLSEVQAVLKKQGAHRLWSAEHRSEVAGLLDELDLLGIVRRRSQGRYELRSRYIARMLGDEHELGAQLEAFASASDGASYDASRDRRPLPEPLRHRVPPLADRDLNRLLTGPSSVRLIVGVDAAHLDHVIEDIQTVAQSRFADPKFRKADLTRRSGNRKPPWSSEPVHRIVLGDLRRSPVPACQRAFTQAHAWHQDRSLPGSVGVGLLLGPANLPLLRQLVDEVDPRLELVPLRRLDADAIRLWAELAEVEPLTDPAQVAEHTGGWPTLLTEAAGLVSEQGCTLEEAAAQVRGTLSDPERAASFVAACGLDQLDHTAIRLLDTLDQYGPVSATDLEHETTAGLASGRPFEDVMPSVRTDRLVLELLGLFDAVGNELRLEPALSAAREASR
jgi:hypothetical protein